MILFIILIIFSEVYATDRILVLNALGRTENGTITAIIRAINFSKSLILTKKSLYDNIYLYTYRSGYQAFLKGGHWKNTTNMTVNVLFYNSTPMDDKSIGTFEKVYEYVSAILEAISRTVGGNYQRRQSIVSIATTSETILWPSENFLDTFNVLEGESGWDQNIRNDHITFPQSSHKRNNSSKPIVLLLGKTKRLNSVSDWHDVMVIGLSVLSNHHFAMINRWLETLKTVYFNYSSNRTAFNLLDPRPALLEANFQYRNDIRLRYFHHGEICVRISDDSQIKSPRKIYSSSKLRYLNCKSRDSHTTPATTTTITNKHLSSSYTMLLEVFCTAAHNSVAYSTCSTVDEPLHKWKATVSPDIDSMEVKVGRSRSDWSKRLHEMTDWGVLRFARAAEKDSPAPFCWENKASGADTFEETKSLSRVYRNSYNDSELFTYHKPKPENEFQKKLNIVILSGCHGSAYALDHRMHLNFARMYYARRHGYVFQHQLSNQFTPYFPHTLWEPDCPGGSSEVGHDRHHEQAVNGDRHDVEVPGQRLDPLDG